MNIAIVTPRLEIGGAETYIISKTKYLAQRGHKILVISEGGCSEDKLDDNVLHVKISGIASSPYSFNCYDRNKIINKLACSLVENHIQIIEAHNFSPILFVAISYRLHQIPYLHNNLLEFSYDRSFQTRWVTRKLSKINAFCVLNKSQLDYIENKCGCKLNSEILPIPVLLPNLPSDELNKACENDYFLSVARLSDDKAYIDYMLKGFLEYRMQIASNDGVRFVHVVGDGQRYGVIKQISDAINSKLGYKAVILKGTLTGEELAKEYYHCYAFVGVGTCLYIAAAFSKPTIIASGYKQHEDKAWGFWGNNADIDANSASGCALYHNYETEYKDILAQIANNPMIAEEMGQKAYNLYASIYDMSAIIDRWEAYYQYVQNKQNDCYYNDIATKMFIYNKIIHMFYEIKRVFNKICLLIKN